MKLALLTILVLLPLVYAGDDKWIESLGRKTKQAFQKLARSIPENPSTRQQMKIKSELSKLVRALRKVQRKVNAEVSEVVGKTKPMGRATKRIEAATKKLEGSISKNRRFLGSISKASKMGLAVLAAGFSDFFESVKPIKGKAAQIALNTYHSVTKPLDRVLNAVVDAG